MWIQPCYGSDDSDSVGDERDLMFCHRIWIDKATRPKAAKQKIPVAKVIKPTTKVLKATEILRANWLSEVKGCSAKDRAMSLDILANGKAKTPANSAPLSVRQTLVGLDLLVDGDSGMGNGH